MRTLRGGIYGMLLGVVLVIPVDLLVANAFLNPVGTNPAWADTARFAIDLGLVVIAAAIGALRGCKSQKRQ